MAISGPTPRVFAASRFRTTIIAAEQTGRICYAMELSPAYVDVAVRRWQQYTGKRATHAVTGQEFGA